MVDLARIKSNVAKMASMNAPEADIDGYISSEGVTIDDVRNFNLPQQPPQVQTTSGRTALDQGLQGATFGFGDEVADRGGAAIASLFTGEKYDDLLKEARDMSKNRMNAEMQQRPVESITSNLAGGLLTGGVGATTKAGTAVANSLRTGNTAARAIKGAITGAASGGLYGAGTANEGERISGAEQGAALGGAIGAAAPVAGAALEGSKTIWKGVNAQTAEDLDKITAGLKQKSSESYQRMRDAGALINTDKTNAIVSNIDAQLAKTGKMNDSLHGKTLSVLQDLKDTAKKGNFDLEELDQYRQLLGNVVDDSYTPGKGISTDGKKAKTAINAIDNIVESLTAKDITAGNAEGLSALTAARGEWKNARKFETVANVIKRADGDPNKLKSGLTRLVQNDKKLIGFSDDEIAALKEAAKTSIPEYLLKGLGRFGIAPSNVLLPGAAILGAGGNPAGAGLVAAGTVARQGQKYMARGKAEQAVRALQTANPSQQKAALIAEMLKKLPPTSGVIPGNIAVQKNRLPIQK